MSFDVVSDLFVRVDDCSKVYDTLSAIGMKCGRKGLNLKICDTSELGMVSYAVVNCSTDLRFEVKIEGQRSKVEILRLNAAR